MDNRFDEYFNTHAEQLTDDLAELIAVNSVAGEPQEGAPYGKGPKEALVTAAMLAEKYGFSVEIRGNKICLIEFGSGETELGILAHLDVVPPAGTWEKTQPFEMLYDDGVLYGRGVSDNKGPAIAALYALRAVKELGIPLKHKVQLILGSDEERGFSDVRWYRENYPLPPKIFTPDASFPVVNTEKGHLEMTITASGGEGPVLSIQGGTVANAVPAECTAKLRGLDVQEVRSAAAQVRAEFTVEEVGDTVTVTCIGKASHAARPEGGVNAISAMLELLSRLEIGDGADAAAIKAVAGAMPFGDWKGDAIDAYCEDRESGGLTVNLGVISYTQNEGLRALVDCRVPISGDGELVAEKLRSFLGQAAQVIITGNIGGHNVPSDSDFVKGLMRIYEDYTGEKGEPMSMGGLTYVHGMPGGVAFGCGFKGTDYRGHQPDECMPLKELLLAGQMFAQAIVDFCG